MVGFGELAGYVPIEAALDKLILEGICDVTYPGSDIDCKPKEAWNHSQQIVS
jgi:hypothetical protein